MIRRGISFGRRVYSAAIAPKVCGERKIESTATLMWAQNAPTWRLVQTYKNPDPYRWWNRNNSSHCDLFLFERKAAS